jgi:hypothetical protein
MTNLLEFSHQLTELLDENHAIDVLYLDFQKAFDKIPHKRLILKLKSCSIDGLLLEWIENWLTDRKQRVVQRGDSSDWTGVSSGVPQGSVLGPILFSIYINDIQSDLLSKVFKFADDTKVMSIVDRINLTSTLMTDISKIEKWSEDWLMPFNLDKCKILHFGKNNPNMIYKLNSVTLESSEEEKDLGVLVNVNSKKSNQCSKTVKSANKVLGLIARNITSRDKSIMLPLYKTLVRPILDYCIQIWKPYLKSDIKMLESPQKRFTKMVRGLKRFKYKDRLKKLGLTTLETRHLRCDLLTTYKIFHEHININPNILFKRNTRISRGHCFKLFKKYNRLEITKQSFANRVVDFWNELPGELVTVSTINMFKGGLDRHLREKWGLT